tara:strand:+ start:1553 stop:1750 length:198 start_codon:yes stop_codon:yes gene_type:complete
MDIDRIISIIRTLKEEGAVSMPTNNVSSGNIAGTKAAGDDPPIRKKKKYIFGGRGSRKMWLTNQK